MKQSTGEEKCQSFTRSTWKDRSQMNSNQILDRTPPRLVSLVDSSSENYETLDMIFCHRRPRLPRVSTCRCIHRHLFAEPREDWKP
mmetsp:Transcript_4302/g.8811  ORF Transcript_4302/g.8811 Transcript_4302/m.8811 type:complete len:86 (+) Transcript_4302:1268-1525(+)